MKANLCEIGMVKLGVMGRNLLLNMANHDHSVAGYDKEVAMQALGSYQGRRMPFLGLGTGLGSAFITENVLEPMELAHLPYRKGRSYEDYLGQAGLKRLGENKWRHHVKEVVKQPKTALQADYVVLGGGNARLLKELPPDSRRGDNANAFKGGDRLWTKDYNQSTSERFAH